MSEQKPVKPQEQWRVEDYLANLKIDFDPQTRIVHLSTHRPVVLASSEQIELQRKVLEDVVCRYGPEPIYLIIELPRFIIEPSLAFVYANRLATLAHEHVPPEGIARYGLNLTRVTVKMAHSNNLKHDPNLFATRSEAEAYIRSLIAKNSPSRVLGGSTSGEPEKESTGTTSLIPPQY